MRRIRNSRGGVIIVLIVFILFSWLSLVGLQMDLARRNDSVNRLRSSAAAAALAEAGAAKALWELRRGNAGYTGEADIRLDTGTFSVALRREGGQTVITATGYLPDRTRPRAAESVRVVAGPGGAVLTWQRL